VANAMSLLVKSAPIDNIFLTTERTAGTYKTDNKTLHGLYNVENLLIGYFYKHKPKGFYLDYYKR
jgi:hypothetical protein